MFLMKCIGQVLHRQEFRIKPGLTTTWKIVFSLQAVWEQFVACSEHRERIITKTGSWRGLAGGSIDIRGARLGMNALTVDGTSIINTH